MFDHSRVEPGQVLLQDQERRALVRHAVHPRGVALVAHQEGLGLSRDTQLEDTVFADINVDNLKVSVFGDPVFQDDDRTFRGVKPPESSGRSSRTAR